MNVLFYITPWKENANAICGRSRFTGNLVKKFFQNYAKGLKKANQQLSIKIIYPENEFLGPTSYENENAELIPIRQDDISYIFSDHQSYMELFRPGATLDQEKLVLEFFKEKLSDYTPDIIIGLTPCHFLKKIWQNSLYLVMEAGYFSRPPFPLTQYFDGAHHISQTFPNSHKDAILEKCMDGQFAETIFEHYRSKFSEVSNFTRRDLDPDKKFKNIILVPLQFEGCPSFEHCCEFQNQYEYAEFILKNLPSDILIIFTRHSFTVLDENAFQNNLSDSHTNFKFIKSINSIQTNLSQHLLKLVDGVITVSSSIGMQAAMWDKFCICIGNSHIQAFADSTSISDLPKLLVNYSTPPEKKRLISYLLKHYYVPFEFLLYKPDWCRNYFDHKLNFYDKTKEVQDLSFYPPIASEQELLHYYLDPNIRIPL